VPRIAYQPKAFRRATLELIDQVNAICVDYAAQGFVLTLRQLFYQFVSRALLANTQREYKRLGEVVGDARLAGLIDWSHLEDRTRWLRANGHWTHPAAIVHASAQQFAVDKWSRQPLRPIVLVEKDALLGTVAATCQTNDVPYFACRGYTSLSEAWSLAYHELKHYVASDQTPVLFHLGDHDPSGLDMTRDLRDRLTLFVGHAVEVRRLALNFDQIQQYNPPPNPAKTEDSRFDGYAAEFGTECWELDALAPPVLAGLVAEAIDGVRDPAIWAEDLATEQAGRRRLVSVANHFDQVAAFLDDDGAGG
jgi:hypothetical protein